MFGASINYLLHPQTIKPKSIFFELSIEGLKGTINETHQGHWITSSQWGEGLLLLDATHFKNKDSYFQINAKFKTRIIGTARTFILDLYPVNRKFI
jgi:hypothetical protein